MYVDWQVKNHTSAHGRAVPGALPAQTSWRGTFASTPASNPFAAPTATAASPALITWHFIDGATSWCETLCAPPSPALTSLPAPQETCTPIRGFQMLLTSPPQSPDVNRCVNYGRYKGWHDHIGDPYWSEHGCSFLPCSRSHKPPVHWWPPPPSQCLIISHYLKGLQERHIARSTAITITENDDGEGTPYCDLILLKQV